MSATWNILTFTVPGKQHISHCVPSSPLRFSKGAKTTTQLGRLHPSLWRKDRVLICRVSLLSFLESTAVLRIRVQNRKVRSVTHKPTAVTHKNPGHFMRDSNHLRRLSAVVSQAAIRKLPSVQDICDVCIVMSILKWTDGTHQTRLPHSRFAGFGCARKPDQTAGRGCVQESHQTFWTPQLSQADSRCQRLTVYRA